MTSPSSPNDSSNKETSPRGEEEKIPKVETKKNGEVDNLLDYCKTHSRDMIAYILLILGILLLFFEPIYGGFLVGLVMGIYFSKEIVSYLLHWKEGLAQHDGVARQLIIAGVAVAFFISAPAIFIGAAIAIAIKQLFNDPSK